MMLVCCSFAFSSETSMNPLSLFVDSLNCWINTICIASLIATPSSRLPQKRFPKKRFPKKDARLKLYRVSRLFFYEYCLPYFLCLLRQIFLLADLQKLFSSPQHAHVTFFVKRDKLELAFWLLCSVHAVIQVPPNGVVGSRNCRFHPFAACTVDVIVCFSRQTVSAFASGLSIYSAQPTPCWLHLAYFGQCQKPGRWRNSCHSHLQTLFEEMSPSLPWNLFTTQILSQHKLFCIMSQHQVRYPWAMKRLVGAFNLILFPDIRLFESVFIYPCTML